MTRRAALLALLFVASAGNLQRQHWSLQNENKETCLILEAGVSGELKWIDGYDMGTKHFRLVKTMATRGTCDATYDGSPAINLTVDFRVETADGPPSQPWTLNLIFGSSSTENGTGYNLVDWNLNVAPTPALNISDMNFKKNGRVARLAMHGNNEYKCPSLSLNLESGTEVYLEGIKVIAFAQMNSDRFSEEQGYEECGPDQPSKNVGLQKEMNSRHSRQQNSSMFEGKHAARNCHERLQISHVWNIVLAVGCSVLFITNLATLAFFKRELLLQLCHRAAEHLPLIPEDDGQSNFVN